MLEHIGFWSLIPIFEEKEKKKQKDKLKASDLLILFF